MVNMLERMVRERSPKLMAVALDAGRDTFRREIYPEYKANRPPSPDDLRSQLRRKANPEKEEKMTGKDQTVQGRYVEKLHKSNR